MKCSPGKLDGVLIFEPTVFGDDRGFFYESFRANSYKEAGIKPSFVQDNISRSCKNALRGLHHQKEQSQGKLIYVLTGTVFDVAVDIRKDSPTFGQWESIILDDKTHQQIYIPPGFAHGFCVLSETADFIYKCTDYYHAPSEITVLWNDPDIGIEWPVDNPLLSTKDQAGTLLKDIDPAELPTLKTGTE